MDNQEDGDRVAQDTQALDKQEKEKELIRNREERRKATIRALNELKDPSSNPFRKALADLKFPDENQKTRLEADKSKQERLKRAKELSQANVLALIEEAKAKTKLESARKKRDQIKDQASDSSLQDSHHRDRKYNPDKAPFEKKYGGRNHGKRHRNK